MLSLNVNFHLALSKDRPIPASFHLVRFFSKLKLGEKCVGGI